MRSVESSDQSRLRKAVAALRQGDLDTADAIALFLLRAAPDDPVVQQLSAEVALQRGAGASALRWARESLAQRPDHPPTLVIAGRAARACQDPASALAFFRRAASLAPGRADAAFLLCVTLLELGDAEAAILLPGLLQSFPDDAEGWRLLGSALQRASQLEAALVAFTRATKNTPSAALQLNRGVLLESLGRTGEAVAAYRAALDLVPDSVDAALKLGLALRRLGDREGAATALERAVTLAPENGEVWFANGLIREDQRAFAAAADAYSKALAIRPDFAEAAVNLGICRQEAGDLVAAKAAYRLALTVRPETFGRIAQALAAAPTGEVWLDAAALRHALAE